jgi:glycosyltransferase involved in cell wall biosynthesis
MYNAQDTIDECLHSLIAQTLFPDMELILVDDCSVDNTLDHASAFEQKYHDNIMLVKLADNGGPGRARNIAMEYASGNYIGFADADDAVVPQMYERLYQEAVLTGSDVVDGGFLNKATDNAIIYTSDALKGPMDNHKRSELIVSGGYIWSKIFRRAFLANNKILFREEYILEDMDFLIEAFCKMDSISNVKDILYVYRDSKNSLSKELDTDRYLQSTTSAMRAIYDKISSLPCYEGVQDAIEYSMLQLYSYSININLNAAKNGSKNLTETTESLKKLRDLRTRTIRAGYNNIYVENKISEMDILTMKKNDNSPEKLLKYSV